MSLLMGIHSNSDVFEVLLKILSDSTDPPFLHIIPARAGHHSVVKVDTRFQK